MNRAYIGVFLFTAALTHCMHVHAASIGGPHGGMSSGAASPGMMGMQAGPGQHGPAATGTTNAGMAEGQSGNGGRYYYGPRDGSVVDGYQPWPESEMRKFQKP